MLAAVHQDGGALRYASKGLKNDHMLALAAVRQDGGALQDAPAALKGDRGFVLAAVLGGFAPHRGAPE